MQTSEIFEKEISYITNETLQNIVKDTLNAAPECIQVIPASSSGKYHPKADLGEGGLVRHIKTVTAIAKSLIDTDNFKNIARLEYADKEVINKYADVVLAACILHDCMKPDNTPKHSTVFDHPIKAANLFKETAEKHRTNDNNDYINFITTFVCQCIASHMGQFSTATYAKGIVLPKPNNGIECFVHLCDYLASRKFFDFNFEVYNTME